MKKWLISSMLAFSLLASPLMHVEQVDAATKTVVTIKERTLTMYKNERKTLHAVVTGKSATLTWKSSNPSIVSVDQKGNILAKATGTVTITASNSKLGLKTSSTITVKTPILATKIATSAKTLTLQAGTTKKLTATLSPANVTYKTVGWSSSNTAVAKVSSDGTITAVGKGTATIKATSADKRVSTQVTVTVSPKPLSTKEIVKKVNHSVVYLEALDKDGYTISSGSGFILSSDGRVVTNLHVVTDEKYPIETIYLKLANGREYYTSKVIGYDEKNDLAILKFDHVTGFIPVTMGDASKMETGDKVVAIGSPLGLENTVSEGIISSHRVFDGVSNLQTTAAISEGSSGGALINEFGEFIGVTSSSYEDGQALNFAIPINQVKNLATTAVRTLISIQPDGKKPLVAGREMIYEQEDNNTFDYAEILTNQQFSIAGMIEGYTDLDFYRFTLDSTKKITIQAGFVQEYNSLTEQMIAQVVDEKGKTMLSATLQTDADGNYQELTGTLSAGTYYLAILPSDQSKLIWAQVPWYFVTGVVE